MRGITSYLGAALLGICLLSAPPVKAADLSVSGLRNSLIQRLSYDWSGFYLGLNAGYGGGDISATEQNIRTTGPLVGLPLNTFPATTFTGADSRSSVSGFVGGGQIGYQKQFGFWVLGIETDIQGADLRSSTGFSGSLLGPQYTVETRLNWYGTTRGKVGIAIDRVLVYGTGGVAYGGIDTNLNIQPGAVNAPVGKPFNQSINKTVVGYAAGAGLEWAFADRWRLGAEYKYLNFGNQDYDFNFGASGTAHAKGKMDLHTGVVKVNYAF